MTRTSPESAQRLITCLETLAPVQLLGLTLFEQYQPASGTWFPADIPPDQLVAATVQLIQYGDACRQMAGKLAALRAIPAALSVVEYGL